MLRPMKPSASFADPVFVAGNPNDAWSVYDVAAHDPPARERTDAASRNTTRAFSQLIWFVLVEVTAVADTAPAAAVACQHDSQCMPSVCVDVVRPSVHPVGVVQVTAVPVAPKLSPYMAIASSPADTGLAMAAGKLVAPAVSDTVMPGNSSITW